MVKLIKNILLDLSYKSFTNNKIKIICGLKKISFSMVLLSLVASAYADINQNEVNAYASAMKSAANAKDINRVSGLIADDVIIKLTRNGKSATLNKKEYLKRLQSNWQSSDNYKYSITISDVVISGDRAKAKVITNESLTQNGKPVKYITESRATLVDKENKTVLLKSVSQMKIN